MLKMSLWKGFYVAITVSYMYICYFYKLRLRVCLIV